MMINDLMQWLNHHESEQINSTAHTLPVHSCSLMLTYCSSQRILHPFRALACPFALTGPHGVCHTLQGFLHPHTVGAQFLINRMGAHRARIIKPKVALHPLWEPFIEGAMTLTKESV